MFMKRILYMFLSCFLMLSVFAIGDDAHEARERAAAEDKRSRMKNLLKSRDINISFYGKVVDQDTNPVRNAEISAHITHYSPNPATLFGGINTITLTTDAQGLFIVQGIRGRDLYIKEIKKAGHQLAVESDTQINFKYSGAIGEKVFTPQKKKPVVFRLRKKGETTCLSRGDFDHQFSQHDEPCYIDIIRPAFRKKSKLRVNERYGGEPIVADLVLSAKQDQAQPGFLVTFTAPETSRLISTDELLHIAPSDGYASNLVVAVPNNKEVKKHIYVKAREGQAYGRLDVMMNAFSNRVSHQSRVNVRIKSLGNPYGDRNIEDEPDVPYDLRKRLIKQAEKDLKQGKRPKKPDLKALIKAEKEKKK